MLLDRMRIVLPNTRILLLKVYIDCYWFNIVQRIVFIEWKTEITFIIHLRRLNMLLRFSWVVVTWTDLDLRITVEHFCCRHETFCFIVKLLLDYVTVEMLQPLQLRLQR